ncbi:peptidyl-prolyl cis-trans isomerase [Psychrosphaera saromensis]|jgi:peptidyl-prolyl cis-trans isomerase B (cyclophilin B)|uniref:Peptidyl-prolyl cis-trans isomerase n=1 Tax=Psychrosphaera saromensis TaxID=716813 RepID=A0A2S7UVS9_9GAMM|nr:peptidylprolyl isomerase [Psychrosphaera saromensis]PQJ53612.1 peptidylprolyl isomerase [Psychrosphaera saromensis]GHB63853.1 peptidyl-prolyl cis-trans isomerase [Psychrosphaera saromensis]GLQ15623.1 peptidyl-prolyl cis-trans isomerase [Psychrosphaera saromensis]
MVVLTTNFGDIKIELFAEEAPKTVENFLNYVTSGFYDGVIFHRVIPGFMVQGGGMLPGMEEKDGNASINNEANNGLKNDRGTLAMARTQEPHSASSQFFINSADNAFLNFRSETPDGWGYCVFAKVVEGMDIVDKISATKTGNAGYHQDVPVEDVIIEKAVVTD